MLQLDQRLEAAGLTLFRDHLAPSTLHYLPGVPRLARDEQGRPRLALLRYRGGAGGGLLTFEVDCGVDAALLAAARAELAARLGDAAGALALVPVLFTAGSVRLVGLGVASQAPTAPPVAGAPGPDVAPGEEPGAAEPPAGGPQLVERLLGSATPSLLGHLRAIFSLRLDPEGATLVAEALTGTAATPLLVVYDLTYAGLRPARGLKARVSYRMAYDYLRQRATAGTLVFRADLDREAESLARQGLIQIEDVDYQGVDPETLRRRGEEVRATLRELTETIFYRPAAEPRTLGPGAASGSGAVGAAWAARDRPAVAFLLRDLEQHESQDLAYDLSVAAVAKARAAPQGALVLPPGSDAAALIRDVDLETAPTVVEVRAWSHADADWSGVEAVEVDLRCGDVTRGLVLSPAVAEGRVLLPAGGIEHRLRVLASDEPQALGHPPAADPAFRPLATENLFVDPQALAGRREVRIALGVVDPQVVARVEGRLAGAERSHAFALDAAHPESRVAVWGEEPLELAAQLATLAGESVPLARPVGVAEPVVLINQPPELYRVVVATLLDPLRRFASVVVEIETESGERRRALRLDAATPTASWSAPRSGAADGFRYRVRKVGADARVVDEDWRPGSGSLVVVGDLDVRLETLEVILLGAAESLGALVSLTSLAPPPGVAATSETLLDPGQASFTARLPFRRDAPRRYRVEGQVFLPDGEREIAAREESAEVLVLAAAAGG